MSLKNMLDTFEAKPVTLTDKAIGIRYDKEKREYQVVTISYNLEANMFEGVAAAHCDNDRGLAIERFKILAVQLGLV